MKNLKKILALVLAFACAFTMFAGAAFTDQADINADNADAVELLTTLNIISGYPDGTFDPEGTVDRAEMAKMIYTIRNGGNDNASAHVNNTTSFTDINGHWAEGYIKYLQNTGIVAGKSATTFDPDSPVTTTEAMKMALALAGYDEKNAELTGPNWSKNTLTLATTIGLTDNVSSAMNAGCTRQDAAQILANVLEATAVRYSAIVENFVNDSKTGLSYGGDPITVGYKWMDLTVYVGRMVSSGELAINYEDNGQADDAGKDRFSIVVDTVNGVDWNRWDWNGYRGDFNWDENDRTLTVKDGQDHTDLVGQEVKLLAGDKIDEVFGVYATGTSNVVETTMDQVDFDDDGLKIDGVVYDCVKNDAADTAVYADNEDAQTVYDVFSVNDNDVQKVADRVKLIDWDDDGDYETIIVKTVTMSEVISVSSSSISLSTIGSRDTAVLGNNRSLDFDDNTIYEDVARNDYAVITKNLYDDNWIVEEAGTVSGTVNGKVENERRVRVDGEWYTLANTGEGADLDNDTDLRTIQDSRSYFENGDEITLYTVGSIAYYAESTSGNDANRSVLMVYGRDNEAGSWNDEDQAKVILADGSKETVKVVANGDNRDDVNWANLQVGALYYYQINNDGEYAFYNPTPNNTGYDDVTLWTSGVNDDRVNKISIADEAVVFALIEDGKDADGNPVYDADVYTGDTVKDAANGVNWGAIDRGVYMTESENGFNYVRMFNIQISDGLKTATDYGYMISDAVRTRDADGTWYMEYEYWNGEENVSARERTSSNKTDIKKGDIIEFALAGEGMIRDVEKNVDVVFAAMTGVSSSSVQLRSVTKGTDVADVDSDTIIFYVDSNADDETEIGKTGFSGFDFRVGVLTDEDGNEYYPANVAYVLDNDGDILLLVIDVENQLGNRTVPVDADGVKVIDNANIMTSAALAAAINDADGEGRIEVNGNATLYDEIDPDVPVTFNDNLTLNDGAEVNGDIAVKGDLTINGGVINGDVTADDVNVADAATLNGSLTINGAATNLGNLTGSNGAELYVAKETTVEDYKFYVDVDGTPEAITDIPAGSTFTWDSKVNGVGGWVADRKGGETTITGAANADDLNKAFAMYDTVNVTDAVTINKTVEIAKGQTLNVTGDLTVSDGQTLTVNGTLNVDGKVELTNNTTTGSKVLGTGTVKADDMTRNGSNGTCEVADTLNITLDAATETGMYGLRNVIKPGDAVYVGAPIEIASHGDLFVFGTAEAHEDIETGNTIPAGTYTMLTGNKWLVPQADSITISAGTIDNDLVQAAFENTNVVILGEASPTITLSDKIEVPAGKTLKLIDSNISLSADGILVIGTLEISDRGISLKLIDGVSGGKVVFNNVTANNGDYTGFYDDGGALLKSDSQLKGTFTYVNDADGSSTEGFKA